MGGSLHQALEGRVVSVALSNGERIDSCRLVSVGRCGVRTLWLAVGDTDVFVPADEVTEVWEPAVHGGSAKAGRATARSRPVPAR